MHDGRSHRVWPLLVLGVLLSCERIEDSAPTSGPDRASVSPSSVATKPVEVAIVNPFVITDSETKVSEELCVLAVLEIPNRKAGAPFAGSVELRNRCRERVAVVTAPIEVRLRMTGSDVLHWEGMADPYAVLCVYRKDAGRPKFLGDAGAQVLGPGFVVVDENAATKHALIGDALKTLAPGEYGAFLQTWAVSTKLPPNGTEAIDLSDSVARHNERNAGQPRAARAQNFMPVYSRDVFFSVE
jgi:hypothetical protein